MRNLMVAALLAVGALASMAGDASAYERGGTFYGAHGGRWDTRVTRECNGDVCYTKRTVVGPRGRVWTRRGTLVRTPYGWRRHGTGSGPNGSAHFGGSGSCHDGRCTYSGGRSGPRGDSSWSGSYRRY